MSQPHTPTHKTEDLSRVPEAVMQFLTSIKIVKKRSGAEEAFDPQKIRASVLGAFVSAGMVEKGRADMLTSYVVSKLTRTYNGHTIPDTAQVRNVVNLALINHNLHHVAKRYLAHDLRMSRASGEAQYGTGITVSRYFTTPGTHPFDDIAWEHRDARITNSKGDTVFEQMAVEVPESWSQTATNVVVSKYFRGKVGEPDRESSVRQLVGRVATTIANWGRKDGYFASAQDADTFEAELTHILVTQKAAFNSPVWFNVGVHDQPQCSACFINSVQDDMHSILGLCLTEGMLFKGGSGTGTNFSTIRSKYEYLKGSNGRASGPVSFLKGLDAFAGVIKSGGKTRRAAKMVILNVDHPDIDEFIMCKVKEEKKAWALMDAGYDGSIDGEAYQSIFFQNANNSVRVTDAFMMAVEEDAPWVTKEVTTGNPSKEFRAKELMQMISEATWQCGDPGMQYDTTINKWHTCKASGRINGSNPCSEYMFLDDTACNLASLNLMQFRKEANGELVFDVESFKKANEIVITAMEIIVGNSSYPTPAIEQNSLDFRPLGIGYANLGALLMSQGLAYDSDEGRNLAAAITSLQSGHAYYQSAKIAERMGPFQGFEANRESCLEVMHMHRDAAYATSDAGVPADLQYAARSAWDNVVTYADRYGLRNAQISVLAPTGTISFLMDCDTTGIEPDLALVKYKWLVGGGMIKIVNHTVPEALRHLGYTDGESAEILAYIDAHDMIEGAPHLRPEHLPVFDCAFKPANGERSIHYMGHIRMMAAVQPFISGAISKTVNVPHEATEADITDAYMQAWKMGIKAIAIYRDGSKRQQALTTSKEKDAKLANANRGTELKMEESEENVNEFKPIMSTEIQKPRRRRLPDERRSITHKFAVGNHEGYITVGLYDDGQPGELFVTMAKEGSVISGLMDSFATAISIGLQYGVPLPVLVNKFVHMRFEPSGYTNNPNIRIAKSIVDYVFRWMGLKFLPREQQLSIGIQVDEENPQALNVQAVMAHGERGESVAVTEVSETQVNLFEAKVAESVHAPETVSAPQAPAAAPEVYAEHAHTQTFDNQSDAPACDTCGSMMVRNASCYKCLNCGATSGCS